jgi:hypothetical protein
VRAERFREHGLAGAVDSVDAHAYAVRSAGRRDLLGDRCHDRSTLGEVTGHGTRLSAPFFHASTVDPTADHTLLLPPERDARRNV